MAPDTPTENTYLRPPRGSHTHMHRDNHACYSESFQDLSLLSLENVTIPLFHVHHVATVRDDSRRIHYSICLFRGEEVHFPLDSNSHLTNVLGRTSTYLCYGLKPTLVNVSQLVLP